MSDITADIRWRAKGVADTYPLGSDIQRAWRQASYAESFPHSYTVTAGTVSRQLLRALANKDTDTINHLTDYLLQMVKMGVWYK